MRSSQILEGRLPELFLEANKLRGISLVDDLLCLNSRLHLEQVKACLVALESEKIATFHKMSKLLMKGMVSDKVSKLVSIMRGLGSDGALSSAEVAQLRAIVNQYLKGPYRVFLIRIAKVLVGREPLVGPLPLRRTHGSLHEKWRGHDAVLSRQEIELIDQIIRYG